MIYRSNGYPEFKAEEPKPKARFSLRVLRAIVLCLVAVVGVSHALVELTACSPAQTQIIDSVVPADVLGDINCVTTELLQGGLSDPAAILAECGSLLMSQLITLAEDLLATPPISLDGGTATAVLPKTPLKLLPAHYARVVLTDAQRSRIQSIHDAALKLVDGGQ